MIKNDEEENIQNYLRNERMWRQAHTYTKWKKKQEKKRERDT